MTSSKVCVIGASGKLGRYLVQHALEQGQAVLDFEGDSQGLPVWSRHVGDRVLASNITRRTDFGLSEAPAADGTAPERRLAAIAAGGFLVVVSFEVALALGAPLGAAAWGGENTGQLPSDLRVASAVASVFWGAAALTVLSRGRFAVSPVPLSVGRWGTWALVGLLTLGAVMNLLSSSAWERFGWAPFVLVLAVVCAKLARTEAGASAATTSAREES